MNLSKAFAGVAAITLVSAMSIAPGQAQNPPVYSPVLLGSFERWSSSTTSTAGVWQAKPDGSGLQSLAVSGELSWSRFGDGRRYFLTVVPRDSVTLRRDVVATSENGATSAYLTGAESLYIPYGASWSHSGGRIAFLGYRLDAVSGSASTGEEGVFVGDVVMDGAGLPVSLTNVHLLVAVPYASLSISYNTVSWAPDDSRLFFGMKSASGTPSISVARVDAAASLTVSTTIVFGNLPSGRARNTAVRACPSGDNRIAFQITSARSTSYAEVWTSVIPNPYNGQTVTAKQITSKANGCEFINFGFYDWSPDGLYLGFTAPGSGGAQYAQVSKINSAGTTKSTAIVSGTATDYALRCWRP